MGLPGSGKTTLASNLVPLLNAKWLNADEVRKAANDWDFSSEGRTRQANRMWTKALEFKIQGLNVVADFVCPTPAARELFPADYIIWMDTIKEGRFDDTNKMFIKPVKFDFKVTSMDAKVWAEKIYQELKNRKFEILVVDDKSTDKTTEILKKFKKNNFHHLIRKDERDLSKSCILGFKRSKYKNIIVMDGDLQHKP